MKAANSPFLRFPLVPGFTTKLPAGLLALIAFLAFGFPAGAQNSNPNPATVIQDLVNNNVKCPQFAKAVAKLIKDNPKQAESIMVMAVKAKPPCACEIVHQGIVALGDYNASDPNAVLAHSQQVASMVALIVMNLQKTDPDILDTVVTCAIDAAPDAKQLILQAIAGIYNGPPGGARGSFSNGVGNPSIHTTPVPTPKPTTPTQNI